MPPMHISARALSISMPRFLLNLGITQRLWLLCVPLLILCLLAVFCGTHTLVEDTINSTVSRNSRMQAQAMSFAVSQCLTEARNQLVVLGAGKMEQEDMLKRMQFRRRIQDIHFCEVAFMGVNPNDRFLFLNHNNEIITLPSTAMDSIKNSPFHFPGRLPKAHEVMISAPTEVQYILTSAQSPQDQIKMQVMRFSTQVRDENGEFIGTLILSLDIKSLRKTLTSFMDQEETKNEQMQTVFIDSDGWMIFQAEEDITSPLELDDVRRGFKGEFGRAGYGEAFRPEAGYYGYWTMINTIQQGKSGQLIPKGDLSWNSTSDQVETVSYAPVLYTSLENKQEVVGCIAVIDSSFTATLTGEKLHLIYALACVGAFVLISVMLTWFARCIRKPLQRLEYDILAANERSQAIALPEVKEPKEVKAVRHAVNRILAQLRTLEDDRDMEDNLISARLRLEKVSNLPKEVIVPKDGIIGVSSEINQLKKEIDHAAKVQSDVLVIGETGTGKELVSRAIHALSPNAQGPFITINCGALDENLLMDTLFGHVKGAFSDARQARKGAFLAAEGGTLMLDEIGTASLRVQQALLRALSDRCIHPLGSDEFVSFNTRVIAATNADLVNAIRDGSFRADLYFRLAVITIRTSPLRNHKIDIPYLVVAFLREAYAGREIPDISRGALSQLMHYHWPGNIRQLRNTIFRTAAFCDGDIIMDKHLNIGANEGHHEMHATEQEEDITVLDTIAPQDEEKKPGKDTHDAEACSQPLSSASAEETRQDTHAEASKASLKYEPVQRIQDILPELRKRKRFSRQEYQELVGTISMRTAQYDLQELVKAGLLTRSGKGPAMRYTIVESAFTEE